MTIKIGIIGGSGLDKSEILQDRQEKFVDTPYGKPSDALITGKIGNVDCVLLARHGRKHTFMPSNVNFRANIYALYQEGCTHVLVSSACGSLIEQMAPKHLVIIDSFIDRTTKRASTFYDGSENAPKGVMHIPMANPFNPKMRKILYDTGKELGITMHSYGTMVTIEGPRFSSKAESFMFRQWGGHVINMTTCPEVFLANELGMLYATVAMVTDYDCWHEDPDHHVSVEGVMAVMKTNAENTKKLIVAAVQKFAEVDWSQDMAVAKDTAAGSILLYQ
eukprot:Colp12_sorted_trinity150504_noHs@27876